MSDNALLRGREPQGLGLTEPQARQNNDGDKIIVNQNETAEANANHSNGGNATAIANSGPVDSGGQTVQNTGNNNINGNTGVVNNGNVDGPINVNNNQPAELISSSTLPTLSTSSSANQGGLTATTQPTQSTSSETGAGRSSRSSRIPAGAIAGAVIGAVALLGVLCLLCYVLLRRVRRRRERAMLSPEYVPDTATAPYGLLGSSSPVMRHYSNSTVSDTAVHQQELNAGAQGPETSLASLQHAMRSSTSTLRSQFSSRVSSTRATAGGSARDRVADHSESAEIRRLRKEVEMLKQHQRQKQEKTTRREAPPEYNRGSV